MSTSYLMQAGTDGRLVTWVTALPDWTAAFAPTLHDGAQPYQDVCVAGGGIDNGAGSTPDKAITLTDGSYVTLADGSYATTT